MSKKVIVVLGATGAQGSGLVDAILEDHHHHHEFAVRAVTRNTSSDKAKALVARGAEVVAADLDNKDSLVKAFEGAYGVFVVTNFWEHGSAEKELQQATNAVEAAKAAGIKHLIWSTLEDTRKIIPSDNTSIPWLGKYRVPHFDAKGEANEVFKQSGIPFTLIDTTFYWDNFFGFSPPQKQADGSFVVALPMGNAKLSGIAVNDIGRVAYGVFKHAHHYAGKQIGIASDHLTGEEIAAALSKASGKKVTYVSPSFETIAGLGFPGAADVANMYHFYHDFQDQFIAHRDIESVKKLHPHLLSFDAFLQKHKEDVQRTFQ